MVRVAPAFYTVTEPSAWRSSSGFLLGKVWNERLKKKALFNQKRFQVEAWSGIKHCLWDTGKWCLYIYIKWNVFSHFYVCKCRSNHDSVSKWANTSYPGFHLCPIGMLLRKKWLFVICWNTLKKLRSKSQGSQFERIKPLMRDDGTSFCLNTLHSQSLCTPEPSPWLFSDDFSLDVGAWLCGFVFLRLQER